MFVGHLCTKFLTTRNRHDALVVVSFRPAHLRLPQKFCSSPSAPRFPRPKSRYHLFIFRPSLLPPPLLILDIPAPQKWTWRKATHLYFSAHGPNPGALKERTPCFWPPSTGGVGEAVWICMKACGIISSHARRKEKEEKNIPFDIKGKRWEKLPLPLLHPLSLSLSLFLFLPCRFLFLLISSHLISLFLSLSPSLKYAFARLSELLARAGFAGRRLRSSLPSFRIFLLHSRLFPSKKYKKRK